MTITLDGSSLTVEKLVRIAREASRSSSTRRRSSASRSAARCSRRRSRRARSCTAPTPASASSARSCSTTTRSSSSSASSSTTTPPASAEPAPIEVVRAAMAARVNVHAHGSSGNRPEITQTLVALLNTGVTPVMSSKGRRRLRRPRPDGPDGARHDGRGRVLLSGRAHAQPRGARARRHPGPRAGGARRPRHHQRLERPHRHERAALLRRRPLAAPGRDRRRDESRGAARQPQALQQQAARAARLLRRRAQRRRHPRLHPGERPRHRQDQDQGAGRLLHALDAPGRRRRPRRPQVGEEPGGDRAQRGRRQPDLRARGQAHADRRELPGHAGQPSHGAGRPGDRPWSA